MFAMKNIPFNLFPSRGATVMFANIEAPNGSSASYTEKIVIDVENLIVKEIGADLEVLHQQRLMHFLQIKLI